jgi:feruloyl esterase
MKGFILRAVRLGRSLAIGAALTGVVAAASASRDWSVSCQRLRNLRLPQASLESATLEPPQTLGRLGPGHSAAVRLTVPFCRVRGTIRPSPTSNIKFEVWLPLTWNGDFNQVGNGGLAGVIPYPAMAAPLAAGYAVAGTDDGTSLRDLSWLGDPDRVRDFGYRAVHETRLRAGALIEAFYGQAIKAAYFTGGSKGGEEALMEAHRYPEDFIGIAAWAPAANFPHFLAHIIGCARAVEPSAARLPEDKLLLLHRAALAAGVGRDGGLPTDPFLSNPAVCPFQPDGLLGHGLSAAQLAAARSVYADIRNPRTGDLIARGLPPGSEAPVAPASASAHGWSRFLPDAQRYAQPVLGYAVFGNPQWNWRTFDFDRDMTLADQKLGPVLDASGPDLRAFKARGGKLLLTQGWDDSAVPAGGTIDLFRRVVADQATAPDRPRDRSALAEAQTFVRLFMIPGQGHGYGFGPSEVNQIGILSAWVEQGEAPRRVIATQYVHDDPAQGVKATRPLFPYPQTTRYAGSGDPTRAESFRALPHPWPGGPRRE